MINKDFREFIELLNKNDVKYLVVGGYAHQRSEYKERAGSHAGPKFP